MLKKIVDNLLSFVSSRPIIYLKQPPAYVPRKSTEPFKLNKILIVAHTGCPSRYHLFIADAFRRLGFEADIFSANDKLSLLERNSYSSRKREFARPDIGQMMLNKRLLDTVINQQIDLVFIMETNWFVLPETIMQIKNKSNAKVILWETNIWIWNSFQSVCLPLYDVLFFWGGYMLPVLKTANVKNALHLTACADSNQMYIPQTTEEDRIKYSCDLAFVGHVYPERAKLFKNLMSFDFKIYGQVSGSVDDKILAHLKSKIQADSISVENRRKLYSLAKIVICKEGNSLHISSPSIRLFKVALCGGFPLVEYLSDLEDMFEIGTELICYYDKEDMIHKINYYLEHDDERNAIAEKCRKKVLQKHTIDIRMQALVQKIKEW